MAGHSKWSNIKRKKGLADAARAKIFTKLGREIQVAVRAAGPDPVVNRQLRDVIAKAKSQNMPNDNIERSIRRAAGASEGEDYEEIRYEGYGPSGVAFIVRTLTDNRNRTAGDVRHAFDKYGGNLGTTGSASYMFQDRGTLVVEREAFDDPDDVEALMLAALEAGADDVEEDDALCIVYTDPEDYSAVHEALENDGYTFAEAAIQPTPENWIEVEDPEVREQLARLIDMLEEHDDVQDVWHNWDRPDEDEV